MIELTQPRRITRIHLQDPTGIDWKRSQNAICEACKGATATRRLLVVVENNERMLHKTCTCGRLVKVPA